MWLHGHRSLRSDKLARVLDALGFRLVPPRATPASEPAKPAVTRAQRRRAPRMDKARMEGR